MIAGMRTNYYEGRHLSQVRRRYAADVATAAGCGWFPTYHEWLDQTLIVTYSLGGPFRPLEPEWPSEDAWVVPARRTLRSVLGVWLGS